VIALWTLIACMPDPEFVTMTGTVFSEPGTDGDAVGGAELYTLALTGEEVDRAVADDSGSFSIQIPSGAVFFVGVEGDGYVPTGFSGQSGTADYPVTDGLLYMRSQEAYDVIQSDFDGCPANDEDGGTIEGWVGFGIDNGEGVETFLVTTAWVTVYDANAIPYDTCYLSDDEDEPQYDPDATLTGQHGRFLVQGSPTGLMTLEATYWVDEATGLQVEPQLYVIYVPEGGVASFLPLWVPVVD